MRENFIIQIPYHRGSVFVIYQILLLLPVSCFELSQATTAIFSYSIVLEAH